MKKVNKHISIFKINFVIYGIISVIFAPSIFNSIHEKLTSKEFAQWIKYKFESKEEKFTRHNAEAESSRYPGIPYIRNSPTATFLYVSESDIGYGDCNVYPMSVFTKSSQRAIRKAWKEMSKG